MCVHVYVYVCVQNIGELPLDRVKYVDLVHVQKWVMHYKMDTTLTQWSYLPENL